MSCFYSSNIFAVEGFDDETDEDLQEILSEACSDAVEAVEGISGYGLLTNSLVFESPVGSLCHKPGVVAVMS